MRRYVRVVRQHSWLLAIVTILAVGAAWLVTAVQDPVYRASMKIVVGQSGGVFAPEFGSAVQPFTQTMANLLETDVVANRVISTMNLEKSPRQFFDSLQVTSQPDSAVLEVSYDDTKPQRAVSVLREVGNAFTALIAETGRAQVPSDVTATIFDPAHLEADPVSPNLSRTMVLAGILGLTFGLVLAFVRDSMDERVRSRSDAERAFDAPIVGTLTRDLSSVPLFWARPAIEREGKGTEDELESLCLLAASLDPIPTPSAGRAILVTSGLGEGGKSSIAANLALVLAFAGHDVVLVADDLHASGLPESVRGGSADLVLTDVLAGRVAVESALQEVDLTALSADGPWPPLAGTRRDTTGVNSSDPLRFNVVESVPSARLRLLATGSANGLVPRLIRRELVARVVDGLRQRSSYVIIDSGPILEVGSTRVVAESVDLVLLVVTEGHTKRDTLARVRQALDEMHIHASSVIYVVNPAHHSSHTRRARLFLKNSIRLKSRISNPAARRAPSETSGEPVTTSSSSRWS